eukprot:GEMP01020924.1.p1 GENE.GEMP01020924.1~~GEMP01020924.1.p1  ORF type:complete len:296 (+),score=48.06 GEMP01020924.1:31-918(+)
MESRHASTARVMSTARACRLLNVEEGCGEQAVSHSWRVLSRQYHPDRAGSSNGNVAKFHIITQARDHLIRVCRGNAHQARAFVPHTSTIPTSYLKIPKCTFTFPTHGIPPTSAKAPATNLSQNKHPFPATSCTTSAKSSINSSAERHSLTPRHAKQRRDKLKTATEPHPRMPEHHRVFTQKQAGKENAAPVSVKDYHGVHTLSRKRPIVCTAAVSSPKKRQAGCLTPESAWISVMSTPQRDQGSVSSSRKSGRGSAMSTPKCDQESVSSARKSARRSVVSIAEKWLGAGVVGVEK